MSKELPYFRFTVSEWLNDDISLENYKIKGIFIDVCSYYWFKDCSITLAMLGKRFSNAKKEIDYIIDNEIIKVSDDEDITISFLDLQYDQLSEKRRKRQEAGKSGGLKKSSNAKAKLKQKPSYKDNDKEKENNKNKIKISEVIFPFNSENFKKQWEYWKNFKDKEFNFKYKSIQSEQAALKKLAKLSKNNESLAVEIIHESFANGWQGLFELKNGNNGKGQNTNTEKLRNQRNELFAEINRERNQQ